MDFIHPFGPPIGRVIAAKDHVAFVNRYIDRLVERDRCGEFDYSAQLVGKVTEEVALREDGVDAADAAAWRRFLSYLRECVLAYARHGLVRRAHAGQTAPPEPDIGEWSIWVVRQFQNDYNPVHTHLKYDVSGVFYTMVPAGLVDDRAYRDKGARDGTIDFIFGAELDFSPARHSVRPHEGLMILFPSFLFHAVYPFNGTTEERRCLSFNATLTYGS